MAMNSESQFMSAASMPLIGQVDMYELWPNTGAYTMWPVWSFDNNEHNKGNQREDHFHYWFELIYTYKIFTSENANKLSVLIT